MKEIIDGIKNAQNEMQLHSAGVKMREFLFDCDDKQVRDLIKSAWERRSMKLISPKRVTTNY